jgi:hypothetical protein
MSEWAKRIRVERATYGHRGRSEFVLEGRFESRDEYELARQYLENLVNVGIKADMLDALREELAAREQELESVQKELTITRVLLSDTALKYESAREAVQAVHRLNSLLADGGYNVQEDSNAPK